MLAIVILLVVLACGPPREADKPAVDIPSLVNKEPPELDTILGKPVEIIAITDGPDAPGEYRDYKVWNNRAVLTIHMYRGKAVYFWTQFDPSIKELNASDLARVFGFDVSKSATDRRIPGVTAWLGTFGGQNFKDVRAIEGLSEIGFVEFRATPVDCPIC